MANFKKKNVKAKIGQIDVGQDASDAERRVARRNAAVAASEAKFGAGCLISGDKIPRWSDRAYRVPFGVPDVDFVTGGGLARGAGPVMCWGLRNRGKSTLAGFAVRYVQRVLKEPVLWLRSPGEQFDRGFLEMIGCDFTGKQGCPPIDLVKIGKTPEETLQQGLEQVAMGGWSLLVVDSLGGFRPSDELDKTMSENPRVAGQATMIQRFSNMLAFALEQAPDTATLLINQARVTQKKIMTPRGEVDAPPHPPGGEAIQHHLLCSLLIDSGGMIHEADGPKKGRIVGRTATIKAEKGKLICPNGREGAFNLYIEDSSQFGFRAGEIDMADSLFRTALKVGVIEMGGGGWCTFGTERWQGAPNAMAAMRLQPELYAEVETEVYNRFYRESEETMEDGVDHVTGEADAVEA